LPHEFATSPMALPWHGAERTEGKTMDGRRFDAWTRAGVAASRRAALRALVAASLAAVVPALGSVAEGAPVAFGARRTCRGAGEVCRGDAQCCSDRCRRKRCDCRRKGAACTVGRGCCSGRCVDAKCS